MGRLAYRAGTIDSFQGGVQDLLAPSLIRVCALAASANARHLLVVIRGRPRSGTSHEVRGPQRCETASLRATARRGYGTTRGLPIWYSLGGSAPPRFLTK